MTRRELELKIRRNWRVIVTGSGCDPRALRALPRGRLKLLGSSYKIKLAESRGVLSAVVYLAPAETSGRNVCPRSTEGCRATCLGLHSGRMVMSSAARARLWKTTLRLGAPDLFYALARFEIAAHQARALALGMIPAVRMDGTSDLGDGEKLARDFSLVQFYDYTKRETAARRCIAKPRANYWATLSYSGQNRAACLAHLKRGGNVAVPFDAGRGDSLPSLWEGFDVIDGDVSDYRPADPRGVVVGLRFKGPRAIRNRAAELGFAASV